MRQVDVWQVWSGRWFYAVYVNGRAIVVGWTGSRETAELAAGLA